MKVFAALFVAVILRPWRQDLLRTALTILAVALGVGVVIAIDLAGDAAGGSFQSSLTTMVGKVDLEIIANGGLDERIMGKLTALPVNARFCPIVEAGGVYGVDPFSCVREGGEATKNDGLAYKDIAEVQRSLGRYGRLDRVLVFLEPKQNLDDAERQIRGALPVGYLLEKPNARSDENRRMLRAFRWNLRVLSYISLVVGAFLIYNTISISVVRRRTEIGILRALGTSKIAIFGLFLSEAILAGLCGAAAGLLLGRFLAQATVGLIAQTVSALYTSSRPGPIELTWMSVIEALGAGTLLAIASAAAPAREAMRA